MSRRRAAALLLGFSLIAPSCRPPGPASLPRGPEAKAGPFEGRAMSVEQGEGSFALLGPHGVLLRFNNGPDLESCYFHPLNTVGGRTLTADRPPDHVWHHGLWFGWKFINGVNYWENDPATGRPAGRTFRNGEVNFFGERVFMVIGFDYGPSAESKDDPVLREVRRIAVLGPDADGVVTIDWHGQFTAAHDVVLDRTPPPGEPGGQVWGGYSGLSARLAVGLSDRVIMTSDGPVADMPDDRYRGRHTAVDYSGLIDGGLAGIAIVDHPANPGSPTPWYVVRSPEMSFFTPAVICYGPMALKAGQSFTLRYRVFVHDGRWSAERLRREYDRFPSTSSMEDGSKIFQSGPRPGPRG